ncbi:thiol:disulfide interchange protein [Lysobacter enzymogenes]|uniref:hypothetical protein n=1 Tax=Lysobacter enzymogenes TaxID=69 RepID=UPI00089452A6|nr:hypothetical protein [Lysobacter enzymogenes]SDW66123.1 hypothetical protein SAMN05421681_102484 [Lysobacter enzymogenes]
MSALLMGLMIVGGLICFGAGLWLLVLAFQESVWWGLGSLLLSPVMLVFVILHWNKAKVPFLINLGGLALVIVGAVMLPNYGPPTASVPAGY